MYELIYTSARQGILPGRSGFSTVACTIGIPPNLISPIENLSAYKPLFSVGDPQAGNNPVSISGRIFTFGQTRYQIISRTGFAGADYTGRTNKISHHFILPMKEQLLDGVPGGMLAIAMSEENFQTDWKNADPQWLNPRRNIMTTPVSSGIAVTWEKYMGDSRWAGLAAAAYHDNPSGALYVEYPLGMPVRDLLKLFSEVVIQLPLEEQQLFTFDTYAFQTGISASGCFLKAVPEGTPLLDTIRRHRPEELISLIEKKAFPKYYEDNQFVQSSQGKLFPSEEQINNTIVLKPLQQNKAPETIQLNGTISQKETCPLQQEAEKNSKPNQTKGRESGNYKLLFCLSIILLILCIIMLVFQNTMNPNNEVITETPAEKEEPIQSIPQSTEDKPKKKGSKQNSGTSNKGKNEKPKRAAVPMKEKTISAAKTNFPIKEHADELKLNGAERIYLFKKFYLEPQNQFLLPGRLSRCKKVSFEFSKIGDHPVSKTELHQYTSMTNSGMKVFAISAIRNSSKITYGPLKKSFFSMYIQDGQIFIQNVNTTDKNIVYKFTIENVKEVKLEGKKESFKWDCQLIPDEDVKYIKPGKLDLDKQELVYTKSPEEKLFEEEFSLSSGKKCYLEIKFCGYFDLLRINRIISVWNKNIMEYNKIKISYNNSIKKYDKMRKKYRELSEDELKALEKEEKDFSQEEMEKIKNHWLFNLAKGKKRHTATEKELYRKLQKQDNVMYQDILQEGKDIIEIKEKINQGKGNIAKKQKKQEEIKKMLSDYGIHDIVREQDMEQITATTSAGKKLLDAVNKKITRYFVIKE